MQIVQHVTSTCYLLFTMHSEMFLPVSKLRLISAVMGILRLSINLISQLYVNLIFSLIIFWGLFLISVRTTFKLNGSSFISQ